MKSPAQNICLSLSSEPKSIPLLSGLAHWIEVRFDLFPFSPESFQANHYPEVRFIATCRAGKLTDHERVAWYRKAIFAGFRWIDLDYLSDQDVFIHLKSDLIQYQTSIIWSYHNFIETPDLDGLRAILAQLIEIRDVHLKSLEDRSNSNQGLQSIQKIACQANSREDVGRLMSLYPNPALIAFGMGEAAAESRIECLRLGAPFTYAHPDEMPATAAGQPSFSELLRKLNYG